MILSVAGKKYDTRNKFQFVELIALVKEAPEKVLLSLQLQLTFQAIGGKLEEDEQGLLNFLIERLAACQEARRQKEAKLLEQLFKEHAKLPLKQRDQLIQRLRQAGYPLAAERVLVSCFDPKSAQTDARVGWPTAFPRKEALELTPIKSVPDLSLYLIPKFRGIHYREEATSRFADAKTYQDHVALDEKGQFTYSPATYKAAVVPKPDAPGRRRRPYVPHAKLKKYDPDLRQDLLRLRLLRMAMRQGMTRKEAMEQLIQPPLIQDIIDREQARKRTANMVKPSGTGKQTRPRAQRSQAQYEQQLYVNQYGSYERALPKMGLLPAIPQISTSDNPYHAAMYAFGAKFSTQQELDAKAEEKKKKTAPVATGNTAGERRTTGTVGKIYTYLFTPEELYQLKPNIVPVMQDDEEVAIKPLQQWEVETTFFGEIPGWHLAAQELATVPRGDQAEYTTRERENRGQYFREKFSKAYAPELWKKAEEAAAEKKKLLVPHGILIRILGSNEKLEALLSQRKNDHMQSWSLGLERMVDARRPLPIPSDVPRSNLRLSVAEGELHEFARVATPADGNCLFHAVSLVARNRVDDGSLRRLAVDYMRAHLIDFHFYDLPDFTRMEQQAANGGDRARWGGHPEIYAMACALQRRIVVHSPLYAGVHPHGYAVDPAVHGGGADIHIFYNGGNHYEALF